MFKIGKSCKRLIFGPVKHEKFSRCLQAITWTNADLLLITPSEKYFNKILFVIQKISLKKMQLKMTSIKYWPFHSTLSVVTKLF